MAREAVRSVANVERAIDYVLLKVQGLPAAAHKEIMAEALRQYVRAAVLNEHGRRREVAASIPFQMQPQSAPKPQPKPSQLPARDASVIASVQHVVRAAFLGTWLLRGRKLGEWRGVDLLPMAASHESSARGNQLRADFYNRLAKRAGDAKVKDAWTDEEAQKLWKEISGK
jgi:hypothetical protein